MADIYLVAGATGGLGQQLVSKLLLAKQHVRVLARDLQKARALLGENLEVAVGDTRQIDTVHEALLGIHTVICTTGARAVDTGSDPRQIDFEGVQNLVTAAANAGAQRFVLVSSIGVTRPDHPLNRFGNVLQWKARGEEAVRTAGIPYTIVRPGGLSDEPGGQKGIRLGQGDTLSGRVSRADVAEVVLRALAFDQTRQTTFEVIEADGPPPGDWESLFAALRPDFEMSANAGH